MRKKILFLVNHDVVIYNFRLELVEKLIQEGHEVIVSSPYGERIDDLCYIGARFIETKIDRHGTNPVKDIKLLLNYCKIMKAEKPDVVFMYTIKPNIYGGIASSICNIRYVGNITGLGTALEHDGILQYITTTLYKIAFRKIQCIYFQNIENKNFFESKISAKYRTELLPGSGVNLKKFFVVEYPSDEIMNFIFISRIMKEKGIEQYLDMAEYIHNKYTNTRFHICGFCEESYEEKLKKLQKKEIIVYHGMVRNIKDFIANSHCTIHPSYYPEGMSNVCLESAACGRPVITTDRSGCRETVEDGVTGYIAKQRDTKDLIDKVEKFITLSYEEKKQMGLRARKKMESEFDRQIVVDAYIREI
ncbi:galacturonosyltransferase [Lachnotalea glycerini]|uniref:Galacturonosyltransferase n=1 Tax=Lachnotalea glycerini TaxID=1763509 RepID=A0A318EMS9_9FIRM|nr:glycosyltransferase family 4 protein [Lachnotalea glycerini]PXV91449.1 galacturonosyltransferase [Lachnotalea glycerini]